MSKTIDPELRRIIASTESPGLVKRYGRELVLRPDWDDALRIRIMRVLTIQKYARHPELAQRLLQTAPMELVEGNRWHDTFFGRCTCVKCNGVGENRLGQILMDVREQLEDGPLLWAPLMM